MNLGRSEYNRFRRVRYCYFALLEAVEWLKECQEYKEYCINTNIFLCKHNGSKENFKLYKLRKDMAKEHYKHAKEYVYSLLATTTQP